MNTPRTDKLGFDLVVNESELPYFDGWRAIVGHARTLERELGEARALTSEINSSQQSWIAKCAAEITAHETTRAQLATLRADRERMRHALNEILASNQLLPGREYELARAAIGITNPATNKKK